MNAVSLTLAQDTIRLAFRSGIASTVEAPESLSQVRFSSFSKFALAISPLQEG